MGWVMLRYDNEHRYDNVADLQHDKLVMFQERHYVSLGILVGLVVPTLLAATWGDWFGGLFFAGVFRTVMNQHFTFSINSFAHLFGNRPYSDQNSSRDNWFLALVTYGEGYHNYHHKFPTDYRNGIQAYHWDPTKWLVGILRFTGITYNLRKVPNETILRAKLKMDEKRIMTKLSTAAAPHRHIPHELIVATRMKIEEAYSHILSLKKEYNRLKSEKMTAFNAQVSAQIEKIKAELSHAHERLQKATAEWGALCGRLGVSSSELVFTN
jgi:stearoyl-CoA desaturase (delta-9 desaturase)